MNRVLDYKQESINLIVQYGLDEAEEKFLLHLPALDPGVIKLRRQLFGQLVQGDNGEWYFDERPGV